MKTANINNIETRFDLSGRTRDSYKDLGDKVKYIGEGTLVRNARGQRTINSKLTHFWVWN